MKVLLLCHRTNLQPFLHTSIQTKRFIVDLAVFSLVGKGAMDKQHNMECYIAPEDKSTGSTSCW